MGNILSNPDNVKKTDLATYAKTSDLSGYAKTSDLSTYAKTSALSGYATTAALSGYATTSALSGYAKTSTVAPYKLNDAGDSILMDKDNNSVIRYNKGGVNIDNGVLVVQGKNIIDNINALKDTIDNKYKNQFDFSLGSGDTTRGDTGSSRALVKSAGGKLEINYAKDFKGGVVINGPVQILDGLKIGDTSLTDLVKSTAVDADTVSSTLANTSGFITKVQADLYNQQKSAIDTAIIDKLTKDSAFQSAVKGQQGIQGNPGIITANSGFVMDKIIGRGFSGPFDFFAYEKNKCVDAGDSAKKYGLWDCNGTPAQRFWFSPVTGQIYNEDRKQCLDTFGQGSGLTVWDWQPCSNTKNQEFTKRDHKFQWRDGDCLDTASSTRHFSCTGDSSNQRVEMRYQGAASN